MSARVARGLSGGVVALAVLAAVAFAQPSGASSRHGAIVPETAELTGTITYAIAETGHHLDEPPLDDPLTDEPLNDELPHDDVAHAPASPPVREDGSTRLVLLDREGQAPVTLDLTEIPAGVEPGSVVDVEVAEDSIEAAVDGRGAAEVVSVTAADQPAPVIAAAGTVKKVLVIPARFNGEAAGLTNTVLTSRMAEVRSWFSATSRGGTDLVSDITPYVVLTRADCSAPFTLHDRAVAAAGRSVAGYDHVLVVVPDSAECDFAGVAYMPGDRLITTHDGYTVGTISHELGHNLGLDHPLLLSCQQGSTPVVLLPRASESRCVGYVYSDPDTVMGMSYYLQPFSGDELDQLGWLQPVEAVRMAAGTVTLHQLGSATAGPRLAVVGAADGGRYTLEFRSSVSHPWVGTTTSGVVVRYTSPNVMFTSDRLDMTPASSSTMDASLTSAMPAWTDPTGTVKINVLSQTAQSATVQVEDFSVATRSKFVPLAPQRVLDTRPERNVGTVRGRIAPGGTIRVPVAGLGGVPRTGVSAVTLNVASTANPATGHVTAYPGGQARPLAASLNLATPNQTRANQVTVPLGSDGTVALTTTAGGHLIADVSGYFTKVKSSVDGRLVALAPSRLLDTRPGTAAPAPVGRGKVKVVGGETVDVQITGRNGVPAPGVAAVVLNVAATAASGPGFVTAWPSGSGRPTASSLNLDRAGDTASNLVTVPVGAGGRVSLYSHGGAHLIADVVGYYTDASGSMPTRSGLFQPITPARWFDTRLRPAWFTGAWRADYGRLGNGSQVAYELTGTPFKPGAVLMNLAVTKPVSAGYVSVYPAWTTRAVASNINLSGVTDTRSNAVVSTVSSDNNWLEFYVHSGGHLITDIGGYWLP